jgi:hypothetical protein
MFNLLDFEFSVEDRSRTTSRGTMMYRTPFEIDGDQQQITIGYNLEWIKGADKEDINRVVFHEIMESLLWKINSFAEDREHNILQREIDTERHRIIRILENVVLPLC